MVNDTERTNEKRYMINIDTQENEYLCAVHCFHKAIQFAPFANGEFYFINAISYEGNKAILHLED